jgi:cellulose biosynthesis protein BcsQ
VILPSTLPNLFVAPSRIALAKMEAKLVGELDAHFRLKDRLEPILEQYPNIVIDCPPTLGLLTVNALVAASHLLIPIQSSYFALEGTDDLLETIEKVRARANPSLRILGVVITTAVAANTNTPTRTAPAAKSMSRGTRIPARKCDWSFSAPGCPMRVSSRCCMTCWASMPAMRPASSVGISTVNGS